MVWPFRRKPPEPEPAPPEVHDERPEWGTHDQSRRRQRAAITAFDVAARKRNFLDALAR